MHPLRLILVACREGLAVFAPIAAPATLRGGILASLLAASPRRRCW